MPAGDDEMVPPTVDRTALLNKWTSVCRDGVVSGLSGFIPGADHAVSKEDAQSWVAGRVEGFLRMLQSSTE